MASFFSQKIEQNEFTPVIEFFIADYHIRMGQYLIKEGEKLPAISWRSVFRTCYPGQTVSWKDVIAVCDAHRPGILTAYIKIFPAMQVIISFLNGHCVDVAGCHRIRLHSLIIPNCALCKPQIKPI